jgi:hypothetical protein
VATAPDDILTIVRFGRHETLIHPVQPEIRAMIAKSIRQPTPRAAGNT